MTGLALLPDDDVFQQAVNYVFTGKIDPKAAPEIVDRKSCVVVVPEKFGGYARYYLTRFKMDDARISNKYSGREVSYELEVAGDDVLVEYLKNRQNDGRLWIQVCAHFSAREY